MSSTATDLLADRWLAAEPTYVSDLDKCQPASALSSQPRRGRWRKLDYEASGFRGVMLVAGPETAAPEVTYPLRASGWHAISIGVHGSGGMPVRLLVKLDGEETYSMLTCPAVERRQRNHIHELFWKAADLTDKDLVLGQLTWRVALGDESGSFASTEVSIAYIKLVPMSDDEVSALQADRQRTDTRRLFAHNDSHTVHYASRPTTAEDIRRHVEPYRDTDISRLYWEAGIGDFLFYFSNIGTSPMADGLDDFPRQGDRLLAESWRIFRDQGVDPFQVALDYAHEIDLEFHACFRVAGFHFPAPHDHFDYGRFFYKHHPNLRGVDRNGNPTPRLAYSYPETRRFVISLLREMAGFEVDGICLLYNRRPPLVEYEPPLIEGFKAEYGEDPRRLDEKDPRWLSYRARTLTQFHREVRDAMDAVAEEQKRTNRIEVSAIVMSSEEENLYNAMDLKSWVDEGLVDTLIPYSSAPTVDSAAHSWADAGDVDYFVSLTSGTRCKLAPNLMPRELSGEDYRRTAAALYEAGAEYFFFWDTDVQQPRSNSTGPWDAARRLGHREEIEGWIKAGEPRLSAPTMAIRKLGDWDLSYTSAG